MKSVMLVISTLLVFATRAASLQTFLYEFEILKAPLDKNDGETPAVRTAKYLSESNQVLLCIDLRMNSKKMQFVTNSKIAKDTLDAIKSRICNGATDCSVKVVEKAFNNSQLAFRGNVAIGTNGLFSAMETDSIGNIRIPTLSKSCETGRRDDSVLRAAGAKGAIEFLLKQGLDVNEVSSFGLSDSKLGEVFRFGVPSRISVSTSNEVSSAPQHK